MTMGPITVKGKNGAVARVQIENTLISFIYSDSLLKSLSSIVFYSDSVELKGLRRYIPNTVQNEFKPLIPSPWM